MSGRQRESSEIKARFREIKSVEDLWMRMIVGTINKAEDFDRDLVEFER
jgi:hypothetical protein